jgi:hypothetical protein
LELRINLSSTDNSMSGHNLKSIFRFLKPLKLY